MMHVSATVYEVSSSYHCAVSRQQSTFSMHRQVIPLRSLSLPVVQQVTMVNQRMVTASCLTSRQHLLPQSHQCDVSHCHNDLLPVVAADSYHRHLYHLSHIRWSGLGYQLSDLQKFPQWHDPPNLDNLSKWVRNEQSLSIPLDTRLESSDIVTSCVHRTQSVIAVFCPFFHHLPSVKHHCKLRVRSVTTAAIYSGPGPPVTNMFLGQWRKCWVGKNSHQIRRCYHLFVSGLDSSQHRFFCRRYSETCL